jgi:hypothetical protein
MCVQIALKPTTCPADGRAKVTGLPPAVAAIEPRTGMDDTLANASGGGFGEEDGVGDGRGEDECAGLVEGGGDAVDEEVRGAGLGAWDVACVLVGALVVGVGSGACS